MEFTLDSFTSFLVGLIGLTVGATTMITSVNGLKDTLAKHSGYYEFISWGYKEIAQFLTKFVAIVGLKISGNAI